MRTHTTWMLLLFIINSIMLSSCGKVSKETDDDAFNRYCVGYVSTYKKLETKDNGAVRVNIVAPDFEEIFQNAFNEKGTCEITPDEIKKIVEDNPEYLKEYNFWVEEDDQEKIEKEFLEEVSREMIVRAIKNNDYKEEWSTEE